MDAALASQECELFADMLHQKIDNAARDFQVDFIQMPGRVWLGPAFAQVRRDHRPKMIHPAPNGLVGDHMPRSANKSPTSRRPSVNRR
jgi:hypothetical protein